MKTIKNLTKHAALGCLMAFLLVACDSFVEDVDLPIDSIEDGQLNVASQVPFVITGIQSRFSTTYDRLAVHAGGLSDELIFDQNVPNATFPTYREFDEGDIAFANNSNDGVYNDLGELRFFSDNLLARLDAIEFTAEEEDLRNEALFTGNFYGGIARYFYATYYGLTQEEGGGVISDDPDNPSPFTPAAQLYADAIDRLNTATTYADDYQRRVINTLIARIHLFQGNYSEARAAAQNGMAAGDEPFTSLHASENTNEWYVQAGRGRSQLVADFIYNDFITENAQEEARIPLDPILGVDEETTYYRQGKYLARETPLPFATWQENELILAETDIRSGSAAAGLDRINAVRASYGIDALASADLSVLSVERRKELFTMGLRLPDQRRLGEWHLGAGTWQYFPITQNERNQNENF